MTSAPDAERLRQLAALVERLEGEQSYVTAEMIRESALVAHLDVDPGDLQALLDEGVAQEVLFTDHRTAFDPATRAFEPVRLYRVNRSHPLLRAGRDV